MMERASPISPVALALAEPALTSRAGAAPAVPVILCATRAQAAGANMRVGGLRVVDRAIRHLARIRDARVVIATDGSIRLPRRLPPGMEVRHIDGDPESGVQALARELGDAMVVGGDTVWVQTNRPDRGTRVVDGATRRAAEDAVFADLARGDFGLVGRLLNKRISLRLTRHVLAHVPIVPRLVTLASGMVGLYAALLVAGGTFESVALGFLLAQVHVILDGCDGELARLRFRQSRLGDWMRIIAGDVVDLALVLAVGLALWRRGAPVGLKLETFNVLAGGTFWDMKLALAAAGMLLFNDMVVCRELVRQSESDVLRIRWWFAHGQSLAAMSGAGSGALKAVMALGRRDFVIFAGMVLAYLDLLPLLLIYMLVLAVTRACAALGQLLAPDWRIRPPT